MFDQFKLVCKFPKNPVRLKTYFFWADGRVSYFIGDFILIDRTIAK